MSDIQDHYELVEVGGQALFDTYADAQIAAGAELDRIWFVRHGDGVDCECEEDDPNCDCSCDEVWDVELAAGQYVNRAGYVVSTVPCRPEHKTEVFTY